MSRGMFYGLVLATLGGAGSVYADSIQLVNGDVIQGEVKSLDGKQVVVTSEILGELKVDREKLRAIHFGDAPAPFAPGLAVAQPATGDQATGKNAIPGPGKPASTPEELFEQLTGRSVPRAKGNGQSVADVVQQLQSGGLGGDLMKEVQGAFPLLAVPEVQQHFQSNLQGLMSGKVGIQDIRKQAVEARDMLQELKDDLGPNGAALNGYLTILEGFIDETQPLEVHRPPAAAPQKNSDQERNAPSQQPN